MFTLINIQVYSDVTIKKPMPNIFLFIITKTKQLFFLEMIHSDFKYNVFT